MRARAAALLVCCGCAALGAAACSDPPRIRRATQGTYDKTSGKLTELVSDRNGNGTLDTWTEMDGARPLRSRIDLDEDGTLDRWEYYDGQGGLVKVGFSRTRAGAPDAWAYSRPDGSLARVDVSSTADEHAIDRREYYENGAMVRVEEDTDHDGRPDVWQTYTAGALTTAEFDENHDGRPDRRLTYAAGELAAIETAPDASGRYAKKETIER